jgi:LysM repeat protein
VETWPKSTTSYVIKKGDSLSVIAKKYGVSLAGLMALNQITDPDKIFEGQRLKLPGEVDVSNPRPVKRSAKPAPSGDAYEVVAGDSLSMIASRLGTSVRELKEANDLSSDRIMVGQRLTIPGGAEKQERAPVPLPKPDPIEKSIPAQDLDEPVIGKVDDAPSVPLKVPDLRTYTVQDGEDLFHVSLMWDVPVDELKRINGLTGEELESGQVLKIPSNP